MSEALKTLAYRYRLRLTPAQEDVLDRSQEQLRRVWNHWVRSQRHAEREWTHGRAASVKNELLELSLAKKATGQALVSARKIALGRGVSEPEALGFMRQEFVEKAATIPKRKQDGSRCLWIARRRLATRFQGPTPSLASSIHGTIELAGITSPQTKVLRPIAPEE